MTRGTSLSGDELVTLAGYTGGFVGFIILKNICKTLSCLLFPGQSLRGE